MSLSYRPEIDGLRALAVLPVILFHAGFSWFAGGFVGVDIFFVISGYLIGYIIFEKHAAGTFSLLEFYENRARRILPALFVVIFCCVPMAWLWADAAQWDEFSKSLTWVSLFVSNHFFWGESGYFAESAELKPLLHTWSLAIEEQYYLVFPLIVMAFFRFGLNRLAGLLITLTLLSFAFCLWFAGQDPDGSFFFAPARVWELLIGAICAIIHIRAKGKTIGSGLANGLSLLGVILILWSIVALNPATAFPSYWTLAPVIGTALIILFACKETLVAQALSVKPMVAIGLISYSAYLWHQPLFAFARMRSIADPKPELMMGLALLSLALAALAWRFVEQPFRKKRGSGLIRDGRKWLPKRSQIFAAAIAGLVSFAVLGQLQSRELVYPSRLEARSALADRLAEIDKGRLEWIRMGKCDFFPTVGWQGKWDCTAGKGEDAGLRPVGIAIVGDSHANDKAMMLRMIGLSPFSYASSGCPITPNYENEHWNSDNREQVNKLIEACFDLMEFGKSEIAANDDITEIWLSNRFSEGALTDEVLAKALEYWSIPGKKLVFFSHTPEFPRLRRRLRQLDNDQALPTYSPILKIYKLSKRPRIRRLLKKYNVSFVDVKTVMCGDQVCDYKSPNGKLLYTDGAHMSPEGARIAGERLLDLVGCGDLSPVISGINKELGGCTTKSPE